jgi:hypothetical protein
MYEKLKFLPYDAIRPSVILSILLSKSGGKTASFGLGLWLISIVDLCNLVKSRRALPQYKHVYIACFASIK